MNGTAVNGQAVNGQAMIGRAMNRGAKTIALYLLRAYKWAISPMFSEYAVEAVERCGAWRGGLMSIKRVLRCHPLAGSGYDPVVKPKDSNGAGGCASAPELCSH